MNEPRYDEISRVVPSLTGKEACKRRLVAVLKDKYHSINVFNTAWQLKAASFDELIAVGLAVTTDAAKADMKAFVNAVKEKRFPVNELHAW